MDKNLKSACEKIFGKKRFEILAFLCQKADKYGFIFITIEELMQELKLSKPTAINAFKFLEEKKVLKRLKNGFYQLKLGD